MQEELIRALREFTQALTRQKFQETRFGTDTAPFTMQRVTIPLDNAATEGNSYKLGFPITAVHVESATDTSTSVRMSLQDLSALQVQNYKMLKVNDAIELGRQMPGVSFTWEAQAGKTITLVFFVDVSFRAGSVLSVNSGGVSINDGSAFTTDVTTLPAATNTALFATDLGRKVGNLYNATGAILYVGESTVDDTTGYPVLPGAHLKWRNTAALYGYSVPGGDVRILEET